MPNNVYLNLTTIKITGSLTGSGTVGVTTANTPNPSQPVEIAVADGITLAQTDVDKFTIDSQDVEIRKGTGSGAYDRYKIGYVYFATPHQHNWLYDTGEKKIYVVCYNDTDKCEYNHTIFDGVKLTYDTDTKTYTGSPIPFTNYENAITAFTGAPLSIQYEGYGSIIYERTTDAPTNVGEYLVIISIGGEYKTTILHIEKADIDANDITEPTAKTGLEYDNSSKELINVGSVVGGYVFQYKLDNQETWNNSVPTATNAGNYKVYWKIIGDSNHNDYISETPIDVTIAPQKVAKPSQDTTEFVYNGSNQTYTVASSNKYTVTGNVGNEQGNYTVTITLNDNVNYCWSDEETEELTYNWTILPKNIDGATITLGTALTYNGGLQTQEIENVTIDGLVVTYDILSGNTGTNATTYTLKITGNGNFTGTAQITWSIAQKNINGATIILKDGTLIYSGSVQEKEIESVTKDGLTVTYSFLSGNMGTNATTYTLEITGNGNFTGTAQTTWSIEKADVSSITNPTACNDLIYDGSAKVLVTAGSATNGTVYYKLDNGTWDTVLPTVTNASTYTVSYYVKGDTNYKDNGSESSPRGSFQVIVAQKEITFSGIAVTTKTYDGNTTANLDYANVVINGKVGNDEISVTATGTYDNANAGTDKTVSITDIQLIGTAKDNYTLKASGQQSSANGDITVREITISDIAVATKTYDGNTIANLDYTNVVINGKVGNDDISVTAIGTYDNANAGTSKTVTIADIQLNGTAKDNYTLKTNGQQSTASGIITAKEITVSGITVTTKTYDGNTIANLDYTNVVLDGKVGNDEISVTAIGTYDNASAGTDKTVSITDIQLNGTAKDNYTLKTNGQQSTASGIITAIVKLESEVTEPTVSVELTYGENLSKATLTTGWAWADGTIVPTVINNGYTAYFAISDDSNYDWSNINGYDSTNHRLVRTVSVTVEKANGFVSIDNDISKTFDLVRVDNPYYSNSGTGLAFIEYKVQGADDSTYIDVAPVYAGAYTVRITVQEDDNYREAFATADFTISKADAVITVDTTDIVKTYGDSLILPEATSNFGTAVPNLTVEQMANAGTYTLTYTIEATNDYNGDSKSINVVINPQGVNKPIADTTAFIYNGNDQTYTLVSDSRYTIEGITAKEAGNYTATVKLNDKTNYKWADDNTTTDLAFNWSIAQKDITNAVITLDNTILTENGQAQTQIVESVTVDGLTVSYDVAGNIGTEAGTYTLTVTGNGNFTGTATRKFVILPKTDDKFTEKPNDEGKTVVVIGDGEIDVNIKADDNIESNLLSPKAELIGSTLENEELTRVANGENVEIWVEVKDNSSNIAPESKQQIEEAIKKFDGDYKIGAYIDVSLFKKFESDTDSEIIHNVSKKIKVSIVVPEDLVNDGRTYYIVRNHEGEVEIINGEYDNDKNSFTFETDKFSDYAIGYKDHCVICNSRVPVGNTDICWLAWLLISIGIVIVLVLVGGFVLYFYVIRKKKNPNMKATSKKKN